MAVLLYSVILVLWQQLKGLNKRTHNLFLKKEGVPSCSHIALNAKGSHLA
jgi:hypothetical protein